ncbi:hypothetical protein FJZ18_01640 [Candidatus Pacearchaeota archaeon]|nr:hypothetical protein [Candidatus Pacearchaeota archaeon]
MSRNLTKTPAFKLELFLEHPKNERLQQTSAFKPRWRIVFVIFFILFLPESYFCPFPLHLSPKAQKSC